MSRARKDLPPVLHPNQQPFLTDADMPPATDALPAPPPAAGGAQPRHVYVVLDRKPGTTEPLAAFRTATTAHRAAAARPAAEVAAVRLYASLSEWRNQ
jgi:hypothetical protein